MLFHISFAALLLQAVQPQPRLAASPRSSEAVTDAAGYAVLHFLSTWRTAWLESVERRGFGHIDVRLRDVHCHWDGSYYGASGRYGSYATYVGTHSQSGALPPPSLIHHESRRSMCPNWFPTDERVPADERVSRDISLAPVSRDRVHQARALLIDSLAILAARRPDDAWITGQRVRFLVDQGETTAAIGVARACSADRAWCAQLTGFALDAAGDFTHADSAFAAAGAAMTPRKRCEWTSARLLLDGDGRSAYDHMSCDERTAANERLWWLATPLFSDSVDDRRSEDFSRKVLVQLHSALPWDERYDWRWRFGGEAVSEMMLRYGWPAVSLFAGTHEELDHASWMEFYDSTRTATAEYPQDRLHLIPAWRAVADPFHAAADAWQIDMPALAGDDEPVAQWWPAEHYARAAGAIVQLPDQTALLRRDDDVLLATASELLGARRSLLDATGPSVLVRTTAPHVVEQLPHRAARNATAIVLTARIPATPAIMGTELAATRRGELSARTRFGIVPPPPLAALQPGETAISDPVFLAPDDAPPSDPDAALQRMLGSTRLRGRKVGVYWETYGFAASDSVDVSVVIARHEPLSKLRRVGMFLRIAHDINGSVAVRWLEPQPGRNSWTIPGRVPIQARSVQVDLSRIEPGHYTIQVVVGRRGVVPVRSSREFVLEGT